MGCSLSVIQSIAMEPGEITFESLREMTGDFSEDRKLGAGAFGVVYRVRFGHCWFLYANLLPTSASNFITINIVTFQI
jgi:hypothetical protein